MSRDRFEQALRALDAHVESLAPPEILVGLARITAMVGELDTGIALHRQPRALLAGLHAFPVRFHRFEDGLFIQSIDDVHQSFVGTRVVSLGGKPSEDAYRRHVSGIAAAVFLLTGLSGVGAAQGWPQSSRMGQGCRRGEGL